ncbi:ribonuclease T2 [Hyphomicrobium sp. CS1GBMeth3]|uniref:ribonuclease T2 family protein n=1 Tax=Hyphomicrobium sp. CS1GBMeth3 TaxID=1892845 RepID=UPI0009FABD38|nr:ribonuclease T2 [Hyphomicrobium sp. CS1GBMeth3]
MRSPSQLTLPGLVALIVLAGVLLYLERQEETAPPSPSRERVSDTVAAPPDAAPGNFDYYSLVLSWSPTHCETPEGQDDHPQCTRGRRYAFILHGLWPQYARGYPEDCPAGTRYVPQPVIDDMLDIMPSKGLIIHEYRKHGTCSGLSPKGYYDLSRKLFESVSVPQRFRSPTAEQFVGPRDVVDAFVAANPQLKPDMIAVACRGRGNRLREVRICFSKTGVPVSCGANETQNRLCRANNMHVPPVR